MKVVHGRVLVERLCACGCGRKFRVTEFSEQAFASSWCENPGPKRWASGRSPKQDAPGLVTASVVAGALGMSLATIYLWAKAGKIPSTRDGRSTRFVLAEVREAVAKAPEFQ